MNNYLSEIKVVNDNLALVKNVIDEHLTTQRHEFNETVKAYFNERAKLIRPSLTLIAASYKNKIGDKELQCAAAMEILHVGTLIHDDIIDESFTRRGMETLNKKYGVGYALICGDYLLTKSYEMLFKVKNFKALEYIGSNTVDMCFGEVSQYLNRNNADIDIDVYLDIIDKKTVALFQSNLIVGATLTSMPKAEIDYLIEFGKYFGRIFQIIDDIKDFIDTQENFGKPVLNDISKGIYSLPIILAKTKCPDILDDLSDGNIEQVLKKVQSAEAIAEAKSYLDEYYLLAKKLLLKIDKSIAKDLEIVLDKIRNIV